MQLVRSSVPANDQARYPPMITTFRSLYVAMYGYDPDDLTIPKHIRDFNKEELERTIKRFPDLYPEVTNQEHPQ
jgi:hypothetical protein